MLSYKKAEIEKLFTPLAHLLRNVNPNLLTILGSIPPILFFVFLINKWFLAAIIAFLGSFLDMIDGMIARKYNKVSSFGGFLDSTIDRISNFFVITAFSFAGIVRWEITTPLLLFAFLTSYIRAQGGLRSKKGADFASGVGIIEHSERMIMIVFSVVLFMIYPNVLLYGLNLAELTLIILTILSLFTVIQRIKYAYENL